jgi:hypothetical protein
LRDLRELRTFDSLIIATRSLGRSGPVNFTDMSIVCLLCGASAVLCVTLRNSHTLIPIRKARCVHCIKNHAPMRFLREEHYTNCI